MEILGIEKIKAFILAGKAIFTLKNEETGNRYTFKVTKTKNESISYVRVFSGTDNEAPSHYSYICALVRGNIVPSKYLVRKPKAQIVFSWLWHHVIEGKELPSKVHFYHEGKCCRCGHCLTTPESIKLGIGPECHKVTKGNISSYGKETQETAMSSL